MQTTAENTARDKSEFTNIVPGDIVDLVGRQSVKDSGDIKLQISMTTKSADVAPILDRQLIKSQIFRNNVKSSFEDELADVAIRLFDLCGGLDIDLHNHIQLKMAYNSTREHKHGKKF